MLITVTVASILALSALVWLVNRILPFTICPICAGVFLTWVGLVGAYLWGYPVDLVVPALLMGGSVVGIAYQLEKKFGDSSQRTQLLWKMVFIPAGFVAAYAVLEQRWIAFFLAMTCLFLVSFLLLPSSGTAGSNKEAVSDIEKKMEDCC